MRALTVTIAAAATLLFASAGSGQDASAIQPADRSVAAHCLSRNPARLGLTDDQLARVEAIRRDHPDDSAERRAAILNVLTRTQWMVYWRTAGIGAC